MMINKPVSMEVFDKTTINVLIQTRNLLDELLETLDIISSPKSMKKIASAEEDVRKGRVRDFNEFLSELEE